MSPFKQLHWGTVKLFMFYCIFVFPREHACIYMFVNYNYLLVLDMHQKKHVCSIMFIISIWSNILIIMYHNQDMHQTLEQELDYIHIRVSVQSVQLLFGPPQKKNIHFSRACSLRPDDWSWGSGRTKRFKNEASKFTPETFQVSFTGTWIFSASTKSRVFHGVTHPWKKATCCLGRWSSLFLFGAIFGLFSEANSQWPLKRAAKISPPNWGFLNFSEILLFFVGSEILLSLRLVLYPSYLRRV